MAVGAGWVKERRRKLIASYSASIVASANPSGAWPLEGLNAITDSGQATITVRNPRWSSPAQTWFPDALLALPPTSRAATNPSVHFASTHSIPGADAARFGDGPFNLKTVEGRMPSTIPNKK